MNALPKRCLLHLKALFQLGEVVLLRVDLGVCAGTLSYLHVKAIAVDWLAGPSDPRAQALQVCKEPLSFGSPVSLRIATAW